MSIVTQRHVCPDCGESFTARGLSGHRRLRHGAAPCPALPRESNESKAALPAILGVLAALRCALENIERNVAEMHQVLVSRKTPAEEAADIERQLAELLQHIACIKRTGLASTTISRSATAAEERASLELAQLRRDQASLVFRLDELRQGKPSDERFLVPGESPPSIARPPRSTVAEAQSTGVK